MTGTAFKPSQRVTVLDVINPQSSAAKVTSGWVDATKFLNFLSIVKVGAIGAGATVDAKLEQATDNAGAGVKDVVGKAVNQLTKAATDDNKQVEIDLKQEDLDFANGFKFFRLTVTCAVAASLVDGTVLGFDPRYGVASDNSAASLKQIV